MSRVTCIASVSNTILALVLPVAAMVENSPGSEADKKVTKTWGTALEGQAVSIASLQAAYAPGEPIFLKACFKNVGAKDVKVVYTNPLALYQVSVLLPDGKPAPLTLFGIQRQAGPGMSVLSPDGERAPLTPFGIQREAGPRVLSEQSLGTLKPGEETCDELELSRLFDFTLAGKYTVSVQRTVSVNSSLKATSNKLELTVDESLGRDKASARSPTDKSAKKTWGTTVEGQALSISTEKAAYAPGKAIVISVCFKNVGQKDVPFARTKPLVNYEVTVLLPDGKKTPLTLYGTRRTAAERLSGAVKGTLKPGDEDCVELELSRLFDFTLAGKYTVSVGRAVWKDGAFSSTVKAVSNKLEITVDETLDGR